MLEDYDDALIDLNKINEFEPIIAFTLRTCGEVKRMLKDYKGASLD